jgi:hypothetical protein
MKSNYWTTEDNLLIAQFYWCYTASTSATTRQRIFTAIQPKLNYMISNAIQLRMSSWSDGDKQEAKQDCLLKVWQVLSTKLDKQKLQGVLNFLWICVNNMLYTIARQHNNKTSPDIIYDSESHILQDYTDKDCDINNEVSLEEVRLEILKELDSKIIQQQKLNRINTIYLVLLKEYLIENDFNSKGFQSYVCKKLGINRRNFYQINFKLQIRSQVFNDKGWK